MESLAGLLRCACNAVVACGALACEAVMAARLSRGVVKQVAAWRAAGEAAVSLQGASGGWN